MLLSGLPNMPEPDDPPEPPSRDEVLEWRLDYLMRAGYDSEAAYLLASNREVDSHAAESLLQKGCSVTTALLILL